MGEEKTLEERVQELERQVLTQNEEIIRQGLRLSAYLTAFINSGIVTVQDVERIGSAVEKQFDSYRQTNGV